MDLSCTWCEDLISARQQQTLTLKNLKLELKIRVKNLTKEIRQNFIEQKRSKVRRGIIAGNATV